MKHCFFLILLLLCFPVLAGSQDKEDNGAFYYDVLQGSYEVIGRHPDSQETYAGKIILRKSGESFKVIRAINNKTTMGTGTIETASADKTYVLRIRFIKDRKDYEATYIISVDLDNYGRLSGYVYLKNGGTKKPGIEALFSDHAFRK